MTGTRIKICGLFRPEDIQVVNEAKPDYCGFVINFPKSHRSVTPEQVRTLRAGLAPEILPIGVFVDQPPELVADLLRDGTLAGAQLHGGEDEAYLKTLRALTETGFLMQAFRVRSPGDVEAAMRSSADYILLDNGQGTGETFDWSLISSASRPFFLAGGLNPQNLEQAIRQVRPWAVDLSSGVETGGVKDREKILASVELARRS